MKTTFTMTSAILGVFAAGLAVGCGSGDGVSAPGASDPTADGSAAIVAVGPAVVSGCNFSQTFAINSPQAIDWIANNFNNLSNLQMQLYTVNSAGQQSQVAQNAQSASNQLCSTLNTASQSFGSNQAVANAFNNAAAQTAATTSRSLSQASDAVNSVSGLNSTYTAATNAHHDDAVANASQFANGAQSARSFGSNVVSGAQTANSGAANNAVSAANTASNANQYANGAQAAQSAGGANQYANGANVAANSANAAVGQNAYNNGLNNAFQSLWGGGAGLGCATGLCGGGFLGPVGSFGSLGQSVANNSGANAVQSANNLASNQTAQAAGQNYNNASAAQTAQAAGQNANAAQAAQAAQNTAAWNNAATNAQQAYNTGTDAVTSAASGSQAASAHNINDATSATQSTAINQVAQSSQRTALNEVDSTFANTAQAQNAGNSNLTAFQNGASAYQNQSAFQATAANTLAYSNLSNLQSNNMMLQVQGVVTGSNAAMQLFQGYGPSVLGGSAFPIAAPACAY